MYCHSIDRFWWLSDAMWLGRAGESNELATAQQINISLFRIIFSDFLFIFWLCACCFFFFFFFFFVVTIIHSAELYNRPRWFSHILAGDFFLLLNTCWNKYMISNTAHADTREKCTTEEKTTTKKKKKKKKKWNEIRLDSIFYSVVNV